jgi:hypothetical protein
LTIICDVKWSALRALYKDEAPEHDAERAKLRRGTMWINKVLEREGIAPVMHSVAGGTAIRL